MAICNCTTCGGHDDEDVGMYIIILFLIGLMFGGLIGFMIGWSI